MELQRDYERMKSFRCTNNQYPARLRQSALTWIQQATSQAGSETELRYTSSSAPARAQVDTGL